MAGEMVTFTSAGGTHQGYLAEPAAGRGPGVIVIQEWWGLVDHIKDLADRFAAAGFVALAPDFFDGVRTTEPDEAGKLLMALNIENAANCAAGAAAYLHGLDATTGDSVGVVGFCMGGQLALMTGTVAPGEVGPVVDFYGIHPKVHPDFTRLRGAVLGLFAARDDMVTAEAVKKLSAALSAAGVPHEFHTYPDTDHAFFNDARPEVYNAAAAEDAWRRTLEFLRQHLG